jgi:hypothetical protein
MSGSGSVILSDTASLSDTIKRVNELSVQKVSKFVLERKLDETRSEAVSETIKQIVNGANSSEDTLSELSSVIDKKLVAANDNVAKQVANVSLAFDNLSLTTDAAVANVATIATAVNSIPRYNSTQTIDFAMVQQMISDSQDGKRYILNTDQTISGGNVMGAPIPNSQFGWGFSNPNNDNKKINWYYYSKDSNIFAHKVALNDLKNMYCIVNYFDGNVENPLFYVYTTKKGDGQDLNWYRNKIVFGSNALPGDVDRTKPILLYTGIDPNIHPEIPLSNRQQIPLIPSLCNPTTLDDAQVAANSDEINLMALGTSSQPASFGHYNFMAAEMGFISRVLSRQNVCVSSLDNIFKMDVALQQTAANPIQLVKPSLKVAQKDEIITKVDTIFVSKKDGDSMNVATAS